MKKTIAKVPKNIDLKELEKFGLAIDENLINGRKVYSRRIKGPTYLIVEIKSRELKVVTPFGSAAFIESHKDKYKDLIEAGIIEWEERQTSI